MHFLIVGSNFMSEFIRIRSLKSIPMKNVYSVIFALCSFLVTFVPKDSTAQCLCSGGVPATQLSYYSTLGTTTAPISVISFPKFNPSIGTLSCVSFVDTTSGVTTTNVWNLVTDTTIITIGSIKDTIIDTTKTAYIFNLSVGNTISGPGISINDSYSTTYGPDSLSHLGHPGDSITYGPNNLYTNQRDSSHTTSVASYLGTVGNVNFLYTLNGGLTTTKGGLNYGNNIVTNYWGTFKLTYYWCPTIPLANMFNNFVAAKSGNNILLRWQALNEQRNGQYQIQFSTDGVQFSSVGAEASDTNFVGTTASYEYQYPISATDHGTMYFRIMRSSPDGKTIYSSIKTVNLSSLGFTTGLHAYPNPAKTFTVLEFEEVLNGNYTVELINTAGQVVQRSQMSFNGNSQARYDFKTALSTGIYYLQVRDNTNTHQYISKLFIQ